MSEVESLALLERVRDLRTWASSRIDMCRREEMKFMRASRQHRGIPQTVIEAWTERRALLAALKVLGLAEINPPKDHAHEDGIDGACMQCGAKL